MEGMSEAMPARRRFDVDEYHAMVRAGILTEGDRVEPIEGEIVELLPAEMVDRILDGEHPIRVWREHRGLTVKALAEAAGIAPAYLSQIETGKRDGTVATVKKLAGVLGVSVDDLVGNAPE